MGHFWLKKSILSQISGAANCWTQGETCCCVCPFALLFPWHSHSATIDKRVLEWTDHHAPAFASLYTQFFSNFYVCEACYHSLTLRSLFSLVLFQSYSELMRNETKIINRSTTWIIHHCTPCLLCISYSTSVKFW